jgi:hypothetical protein
MAQYLTSDDKYRRPSGYSFGRIYEKRVRTRTALSRVNGYLKNMIEAVANSKLRRMQRELELRGIRFDRPNESWQTRQSERHSVRGKERVTQSAKSKF